MGNVQSTRNFTMNISPSPMGPLIGKTSRPDAVSMTEVTWVSEEDRPELWAHGEHGLISRGPNENDEQIPTRWQPQTHSHQGGDTQTNYPTDRQVALHPQLKKILGVDNDHIQTIRTKSLLEIPVTRPPLGSRDSLAAVENLPQTNAMHAYNDRTSRQDNHDSRVSVKNPHQTYALHAYSDRTSGPDYNGSRAAVENSHQTYEMQADNGRSSSDRSSHIHHSGVVEEIVAKHKCTDIQVGPEFEESVGDVSSKSSGMVRRGRTFITRTEMGVHSGNFIPQTDILASQVSEPEWCVGDVRNNAQCDLVQGKNFSIECDGISTGVRTTSRSFETIESRETMMPDQIQAPQVPYTRETMSKVPDTRETMSKVPDTREAMPQIPDTREATLTSRSSLASCGGDPVLFCGRSSSPPHCEVQGNEASMCFGSQAFSLTTSPRLVSMQGSILFSQNFISDRTESFVADMSRDIESAPHGDFEPMDKFGVIPPRGVFDSFDTDEQIHQNSIESQLDPDVESAVSAHDLNFEIEQSNLLSSDYKNGERCSSRDDQSRGMATCICCQPVNQDQVRLFGHPGTGNDSLKQPASHAGDTNSFSQTYNSAGPLDSWQRSNNFQPDPNASVQDTSTSRLFSNFTDSCRDPSNSQGCSHHECKWNTSVTEQSVEGPNSPERDDSTNLAQDTVQGPYGGLAEESCRHIFNSQQTAFGNIRGYDSGDFNEPYSVQKVKQKLKELNHGLCDQDDIFEILTPRNLETSSSREPEMDIDMDPILPGTVCHPPVVRKKVHSGQQTRRRENGCPGCPSRSDDTHHSHQPAKAAGQTDSSEGTTGRDVVKMKDRAHQEKKEHDETGSGEGRSKMDRRERRRDKSNMEVDRNLPAFTKHNFVAYLCCAPEDLSDFGLSFHAMLESWGFRIFIAPRDLQLTGAKYDNMAHWLEERCNGKIIVVLSKNYSASGECLFLTYFAKTLDPDARKRNIIPVQIDKDVEFLNVLKGVSVIKYNHDARNRWLKKKLVDAIAA